MGTRIADRVAVLSTPKGENLSEIEYELKRKTVEVSEKWIVLPSEVWEGLNRVLQKSFRRDEEEIGKVVRMQLISDKGYSGWFEVRVSLQQKK